MIVLFISFVLSVFSASPAWSEQIVEGLAALVTIKAREPIRELIFYSDLERYRLFFAPPEEKSDLSERLNQVLNQRLLRPEARRFILQAPTAEAIEKRLNNIQKRFEDDAIFEAALSQTGLIQSELVEEIREYLWVEQLLNERIKGFVFISPKAIEDYFYEHPDLFEGRTLPELSQQIETFLITKKEAEKKIEYLQRIKTKAEIEILLNIDTGFPK